MTSSAPTTRGKPAPGKKASTAAGVGQPAAPLPLADRFAAEAAALPAEARAVWDRFTAWEQDHPVPKLFAMKHPLTPAELAALVHKHSAADITAVLLDMQNTPNLLRRYESANLTVQSWLRTRQRREEARTPAYATAHA